MQTIKLKGIVLQTVPIRDSDLIVHILTEDNGRIHAIARSARKSRKRFIGGLDLFDCGLFEFTNSSVDSDLADLRGFERTELWLGLRENLSSFALASIVLDLVGSFSHPGVTESGRLLAPVIETLRHINSEHDPDRKLTSVSGLAFHILTECGYDPLSAPGLTPDTKDVLKSFRNEARSEGHRLGRDAVRGCLKELLNFTERTLSQPLKSRRQFPKNLIDELF